MTDAPSDDARPLQIGDLTLPQAVDAAVTAAAAPAEGLLFRARWGEASRFVLLVRRVEKAWIVAPVTLDPELATDEAYLLRAEDTDFEVPVAVWLDLAAPVPAVVLERNVGRLRISLSDLRHGPVGRRVRTVLDERAMERVELQDDLDELSTAAAAPMRRTLAELLDGLTLATLRQARIPTAHAFALLRGERPPTPQEAELLAPLAGVSPAELLEAGPRVSEEEVRRVLADPEVASLVQRRAEQEGVSTAEVGAPAVHEGYALAARETGGGERDLVARTVQYLKALLGDE